MNCSLSWSKVTYVGLILASYLFYVAGLVKDGYHFLEVMCKQ